MIRQVQMICVLGGTQQYYTAAVWTPAPDIVARECGQHAPAAGQDTGHVAHDGALAVVQRAPRPRI